MKARARYVLGVLALGAICFVTGIIALSLHAIGRMTSLLWVPSAIGFAVCLLYGVRWWPGVALGTFLIFLTRDVALYAVLIVAAVDVGEVLLGCWILRALGFRPELDRVSSVVYFVVVSAGISLLSATASVTLLYAVGALASDRVPALWSMWWWGHLSGDLIVAPAILTWTLRSRAKHTKNPPKPAEAVALMLTVLLVVLLVLGRWLPPWLPGAQAPYYLLPMLLWAGVRFGPRGAALASLGASVTALIAQSFGLGPFSRLFDLHSFVVISSISTLMLSALAIERVRAVSRKGAVELAALDGIITINDRGEIVEINPAAERMFGIREADVCGKDMATLLLPPEYREAYYHGLSRYVSTGEGLVGSRYRSVARRPSTNTEFPVEIAIARVPVEGEFLITGFIRDVSIEQKAEQALLASREDLERKVEERFQENARVIRELELRETLMRQAEELAHLGSFDFDLKTEQLHWSDELFRIYGRARDSFPPSYASFLDAVHPEDRGFLQSQLERAIKHLEPHGFQERIVRPDGSVRILQTQVRVISDHHGRPVRLAGCCQDVTERMHADATRSRLVRLVESSDDAMIVLSKRGAIETWNAAAARLFGYATEEVLGRPCAMLVPEPLRPRFEELLSGVRGGEQRVQRYELQHQRKDGTTFEAAVTTSAVVGASEQVVGISKVLRDVTHQKSVEKQMRGSLQEKEVLLREIHHRVKNNLQVIASLLNIQVSAERSVRSRKGLLESQNRIHSMALMHQLLYQSKDLAQIDAGEYLAKLTNQLVQTYDVATERISVRVISSPLRLDIDRAIPCGLIVNELVTNALTHAFPHERSGHVWVALEQTDDTIMLSVADDGIGIPADLDLDHVQTFGLRIAHTLAQQLEGTITLIRDHGTKLAVVFPGATRHDQPE